MMTKDEKAVYVEGVAADGIVEVEAQAAEPEQEPVTSSGDNALTLSAAEDAKEPDCGKKAVDSEIDLAEKPDVVSIAEKHPWAKRAIGIALILVIALVSVFGLAETASTPETYTHTIASLDEKKATVTGMLTASTAASATISFAGGERGSVIAQKLADLSGYLLVILAAIYLEKYLLTTIGGAFFGILVPVCCLMLAVALLLGRGQQAAKTLKSLSARLLAFGLALFLAVPASVGVSDSIEATYAASTVETAAVAEAVADDAAAEGEVAVSVEGVEGEDPSILGWLQGKWTSFNDKASEVVSDAGDAVAGLLENGKGLLAGFIEAIAIMIITSCVIPILVVVLFLWLAKVILGLDLKVSGKLPKPGVAMRAKREAEEKATLPQN